MDEIQRSFVLSLSAYLSMYLSFSLASSLFVEDNTVGDVYLDIELDRGGIGFSMPLWVYASCEVECGDDCYGVVTFCWS